MLALALVLGFCLIVSVLNGLTRADAKAQLKALSSDVRRAHNILSADPRPSEAVARALAFLERWI